MNISLGDDLPVMKSKKDNKKSSTTNNPPGSVITSNSNQMSTIDLSAMMTSQQLINRSQRESMAELMRSKTRDPIHILSSCTAFSRREVKMIYRNFKQVRSNFRQRTNARGEANRAEVGSKGSFFSSVLSESFCHSI